MGFLIGIIKKILKLILYSAIFVAIVLLIPNLPPYTKFTSIKTEPTQQKIGPLAPNVALNNVERLYEGKLLGPEAFQIWNDEVYTSLATGEIVKVSPGGHVTFVTKIGQPCTGLVQEHLCGRPLGFVIDEKSKFMYVADAYHGIWKVNLVTDKKQLLVSPRVAINGRTPKFFNAVALDKNGDLFWTDSSSDFSLKDGVIAVLTDPTGRLFQYNAAKNESKVLLDNLWIPNGLAISADNQFVVVAETSRYRLVKYYINGPKKGTSEVFVAGLPGLPDNVRPLPDGSGVLVALYNVFGDEDPLPIKTMSSIPLARKFCARLLRLAEIPFEFLNSQFPNYIFEEIVYKIGSYASISGVLTPSTSGLVQIDWNGQIVAAYYNNDSSINHVSDAIVFKDKLYIGSPHIQNYIAAVPAPALLKKAFSSNQPQIKEQPRVVSDQREPKKQEKKEVPKVTKPVAQTKTQPSDNKVSDKSKQAPPHSKTNTEKQPEVKQKEPQLKTNAVPKGAVPKSKVDSKEAEIKTNEIPKAANEKSKVAPKETAQKTTPKEDSTPKVTQKQTEKPKTSESKPKTEQKQPEVKPVVAPKVQEKPKDVPKVVTKKIEEPKLKPVSKETEKKPAEVKSSATKESKAPESKSNSQNANLKKTTEPKVAEADKQKTQTKSGRQIPVAEEIPSDTIKPNKEKLKVIKKSGPEEIPNPHL